MSAYLWAVVGMAPVGSLILGSLAEAWDALEALVFGATVCAVSAAAVLAALPQVRRMA